MKKILLIESNDFLLKRTSQYLIDHGYDVVMTKEGSVGIQKALEHNPDIILCDSNSEVLNGYEVFNTLQQINSTSVIPFILITSESSRVDIRDAMNMGVDDYIVKPYNLEELSSLIEIRLEKQEKIIKIADEKFNALIEHSYDGMYVIDDERLSFVNKKFCQILGYTKKELIGMNLVNIIYKDDIRLVVDKIERCIQGIHKEIKVEYRAITRDNKIINVELTGSIVNSKGKKSLVGSFRNVDVYSNGESCQSLENIDIKFTKREQEILHLICEGLSNSEIAEKLNISDRTVEGHRSNILNKVGCKNSVCLAVFAVKNGFYKIN